MFLEPLFRNSQQDKETKPNNNNMGVRLSEFIYSAKYLDASQNKKNFVHNFNKNEDTLTIFSIRLLPFALCTSDYA